MNCVENPGHGIHVSSILMITNAISNANPNTLNGTIKFKPKQYQAQTILKLSNIKP